jgi:uncharacterized protein YkwD
LPVLFLVLTALLLAACAPAPRAAFGPLATELSAAVNQQRRAGATCGGNRIRPAPPLRLEQRLIRTAELHTADMVTNGYFSHTGTGGTSVGQRVTRQGYGWRAVGENIAWGQRSVDQVVAAWMASPGHCTAIMSGDFQELGAARVADHWTLVFAAPR